MYSEKTFSDLLLDEKNILTPAEQKAVKGGQDDTIVTDDTVIG